MSSAKTIAKNTSYLFIAEAISRALSLILVIALARYLGDATFGKYSFAFALVFLFVIFTDFGLSTFITRELAKDKNKTQKYFSNLIALKVVLLLVSLFFSVITVLLIESSLQIILLVTLAALAVFFENLTLTFGILFISHEKMQYSSLVIIIERILAVVLGLFVLVTGYGLGVFIVALIISRVISFLISCLIVQKKFIKIRFEFDLNFWKYLIKNSSPFWFTRIFMIIYYKTDTLMLSLMTSYAITGWYNAAGKLVETMGFIPKLIILATFPAMSRFHTESKKLLSLLYQKSFYYLFAIAFPMGIGTTLLADKLILLIYKDQFISSILILKILVWASALIFINSIMGYLLNAINKQKLFTLSSGITALINVILNFILILAYGLVGAAIATVATQAISFTMLSYFTSKKGYKLNLFKLMIKPVIAGIVMGIAVISLSRLHLFLLIPIGIIIYLLILTLIGGFGKEEIRLIRSIFHRRQLQNQNK